MNKKTVFLIVVIGLLLGVIGFLLLTQPAKQAVINTPESQSVSPVASSPSLTASPSATVIPISKLSKKSYTVALFGDSYIDTMIDYPRLVEKKLELKYPGTTFTVYNYGIGAQNVADGLARWDSSYSNRMNRNYPPITEISADIIILGSFSYNPFANHDKERHKTILSQLVDKAKQTGAQVYILAEIAPAGAGFGDGERGINWSDEESIKHSQKITEQLENVFTVAAEKNVPVINAYAPSKEAGSPYAKPQYVNKEDGVHPSAMGQNFTVGIIASTIVFK